MSPVSIVPSSTGMPPAVTERTERVVPPAIVPSLRTSIWSSMASPTSGEEGVKIVFSTAKLGSS